MKNLLCAILAMVTAAVFFSTISFACDNEAYEITKPWYDTRAKAIVVTVKLGDTLSGISLKYLGDGTESAYESIAFDNRITDSSRVFIGQKIFIWQMRRVGWTDSKTGKVGHSVWNFMTEEDNRRLVAIFKRDYPYLKDYHIDSPTVKGLQRKTVR